MNRTRRSLITPLTVLTFAALAACDPGQPSLPKLDGPKDSSQSGGLPCEGYIALPNGELTLTRTQGPPNTASLTLPNLSSFCIALESEASSAMVALGDTTLWSPSFFKNKPQSDSALQTDLDSEVIKLHASITGKPGSFVKLRAYSNPKGPIDGLGPSTPDEAFLIGEAFIKYHHDTFPDVFGPWHDAHVVKVTALANAEGTVEAYELTVERGGAPTGYLVLERDVLRPLLGSAALAGPPLSETLVAAYEAEHGASPFDAPTHRFLWGGGDLMAIETLDGDEVKRTHSCDECTRTYETARRPQVERAALGISDDEWIAERKLKVERMLDHLAMGEMGAVLPSMNGDLMAPPDAQALDPQTMMTAPSQEPSRVQTCPVGMSNSIPGGKDAFTHYYQTKSEEGVDECHWEMAGVAEKFCGWPGCVPIATLTLLGYWDRRYPYLLPYNIPWKGKVSMGDQPVIDAINKIRRTLLTLQLVDLYPLPWWDQAYTPPGNMPLLTKYIDERAGKAAGWTVAVQDVSEDGALNERLNTLKREIDAGYPSIMYFHGDPGDEGWGKLELNKMFADHAAVAFAYVDDGNDRLDDDMVHAVYGWKNTHEEDQRLVPLMGTGAMYIASVRPDCTGASSGDLCAQFSDIPPDHWGKASAETLACLCVVRGYPSGKFEVDNDVTKAEFLKMIVMLAYAKNLDGTRVNSKYACAGHWASGYIDFAVKAGMLDGLLVGETFEPDQPITREEAAHLVVQAGKGPTVPEFKALFTTRGCFEKYPKPNPYKEEEGQPTIDPDFLNSVLATTSACVFEGYQPSKEHPFQSFKPQNTISRIEAAKVACVARFGFGSEKCKQNHDCAPLETCDE